MPREVATPEAPRDSLRVFALIAVHLAFSSFLAACDHEGAKPDEHSTASRSPTMATERTSTVAATTTASAAPRSAPPASPDTGPSYAAVSLESTLEEALVEALGREIGSPLTQVTNRVLVWWIDVPRELRRGDRVEIVYEPRQGEEPLVHAIWLRSEKLGKVIAGVRYRPEGEPFARWYNEEGTEIEARLKDGPIDAYEQVTSLLHDGRRHKGVDFKAPVGTPVRSPFDGYVSKRSWSRGNGNFLELTDPRTGNNALLLHLERVSEGLHAGSKVKRGQEIARSGNTGRSTAPHLHYQLERKKRLLDPFKVHPTWRAKLGPEDVGRARDALARYALLRRPEENGGGGKTGAAGAIR